MLTPSPVSWSRPRSFVPSAQTEALVTVQQEFPLAGFDVIGLGELDRRVPSPGTGDEIDELLKHKEQEILEV